MDYIRAIKKAKSGRNIARQAWPNKEWFFKMDGDILVNTFNNCAVVKYGDAIATDWYCLPTDRELVIAEFERALDCTVVIDKVCLTKAIELLKTIRD